jgi:anti-anti-sigma factor
MFKMELEYKNGILFARLKGILNRKNSYKINNYLNPVLKKHNIKCLVYNFENLESVDNTGIDAILNSKYTIKLNKGVIRVCGSSGYNEALRRYLKIPRIDKEMEALK